MGRLTAIVLGSAGGGGYPQWNCLCPACRLAWGGDKRAKPRTQASLAVTADGERWTLINASPDLRAQIMATSQLRPRAGARGSPIAAVVLTGAEVDQVAGLLTLRERQPFALFGTAQTLATLKANPIFGVLADGVVTREAITPGVPFALPGGLSAELFGVPGKVPLYLEDGKAPAVDDESNAGAEIIFGSRRLAYVPGAAAMTPALHERLAKADVVLFDATVFVDDEMIAAGIGEKTGRRMGHMPLAGEGGSLAALAGLPGRRILTHINNSNPILIQGSPERAKVEALGFQVAEDGVEIVL